MSQLAVFVDAGYLFAQGSVALNGSKIPRHQLVLDTRSVIAELYSICKVKCDGVPFLRIYWYDGVSSSRGMTPDHAVLAHTDHVKLRLGLLNNTGQQKGVDSLIITDLIELARNRAISDCLLLSGDEDVRVGVSIAQSLGVRVHLLGIVPSRGSQSIQLLQEADTTSEWDRDTVSKFLAIRAPSLDVSSPLVPHASSMIVEDQSVQCEIEAQAYAEAMDMTDAENCKTFISVNGSIPHEVDKGLLTRCKLIIGRDLTTSEKRQARHRFSQTVGTRV